MAITQDGSHAFGIEDSPITINAVTYVCEGMSFSHGANRVDINDSNGEPLGSTVIPGRVEGSGSIQLATAATAVPTVGQTFDLSGGRNDGTYMITEIGEAQSAGDYVKLSITYYKKVN